MIPQPGGNLRLLDPPAHLGNRLLDYSLNVPDLRTPGDVLDQLNTITAESLGLNVLGAVRFPEKVTDWKTLGLDKILLHPQTPRSLWEQWIRLAHHKVPIGYLMARTSLVPHTWTESMRLMQLTGMDRWGFELALKYGMRDGLFCPVGGRWLVGFWSSKVLSNILTQQARILVFGAASFAAMRLEQLVEPDQAAQAPRPQLTPRELAVLRSLSMGTPFKETAKALGLGEETIRTHLKKAQAKLCVRNRTQAVAEAIRQHLIP